MKFSDAFCANNVHSHPAQEKSKLFLARLQPGTCRAQNMGAQV